MHDSDGGNTLRGIFLTSFTAFLIFAFSIFGIHLANPTIMTAEPEVATFEFLFYHPEIESPIHEDESADEIPEDTPVEESPDSLSFLKWWINFSELGMLLSACICFICLSYARYQYNAK